MTTVVTEKLTLRLKLRSSKKIIRKLQTSFTHIATSKGYKWRCQALVMCKPSFIDISKMDLPKAVMSSRVNLFYCKNNRNSVPYTTSHTLNAIRNLFWNQISYRSKLEAIPTKSTSKLPKPIIKIQCQQSQQAIYTWRLAMTRRLNYRIRTSSSR